MHVRLYLILLCLGVVCSGTAFLPRPSPSCVFHKANLTCSHLENLVYLNGVFERSFDHPIYRMELTDSALLHFPSDALTKKKIRELRVENSTLVKLFDRLPQLNEKLGEFRVVNLTILTSIKWELFKNFRNLTILEFQGVEIRKVGSEFRENIQPDIEHVYLARTRRSIVKDHAFDRLTKLRWVGVTGGRTSVLKRSMFARVTSIKFMDFSGNRLSSLPSDMFDRMPKLTFINLENNLFTSLSEKIFGNMFHQGFKMNMMGNKFICDCSIRWYAMHEQFYVIGMCTNPPAVAGKELKDLKAKDFDYCDL